MIQKNQLKLAVFFILLSCSLSSLAQKKIFDLKGQAEGNDGHIAQLIRDLYGNATVLAKDTVKNGKFHFKLQVDEIIPVTVNFKEGKQSSGGYSVILEPGKLDFKLYANGRKLLRGGKYNKQLFGYESDPAFIKADDQMRETSKKGLDNIKDQQTQYEAMQIFLRRNELREEYLVQQMKNSKETRVKLMAAILLELQPDRAKAMDLVESAAAELGENDFLITTARQINRNQEMNIEVRKNRMNGQQYIDFKAAALNGDSTQLSDLIGSNKYTLLQFWASWCVPCRHEIPLLKKLYNENQNKGFGIVSFSLDENKIAWTKASEKENFAWSNISDLKGFSSMIVRQYQVSGIPANVIIDQQGKIVASNLVGEDLQKKIEELMK